MIFTLTIMLVIALLQVMVRMGNLPVVRLNLKINKKYPTPFYWRLLRYMTMANALETRWHGIIADWYQSIGYSNETLNDCYRNQHHHVIGRKGKHNKVHIGGFFVLPLPAEFHDPHSNSVYNVTHRRHNFTAHFGLQSELFKEMIDSMVSFGYDLPFGQDVIDAIMDTGK